MATFYLPLVIRITRVLLTLLLVSSVILSLGLLGQMAEAASTPEVRLQLDTRTPNMLGFWHEMQAGFADDQQHQRRANRGPLPALPATATYELAANSQAPLLRYREPSAWKRVVLLALGALDDGLSVASLALLAGGCWLLLGLLRKATPATPFVAANARRLVLLAALIALLNLWQYVAYALVWALVPAYRAANLAAPLSHYVRLGGDELVPGYVVVFMLLIIAAAYRRGAVLAQEAELVI